MGKLNKAILSPVVEEQGTTWFNVAGHNFKMANQNIELTDDVNSTFMSLVEAVNTFSFDENSISFLYDYNNKTRISKTSNAALESFDKLVELEAKAKFLNESRKKVSLNSKTKTAVSTVQEELSLVESEINSIKKSSIAVRFSYNVTENKFYANNIEMLNAGLSLSESVFSAGYIKYEDKAIFNLFELASNHFNLFKTLDFVTETRDNDIVSVAMRSGNNTFIFDLNESTRISAFKRLLADEAIEYVAERTGADITFMVEDILESFVARREAKTKKLSLMQEMIFFLKDQKGRLAEANRNLTDIKAADNLLDSEIKRISEEITELQNEDLLTTADGYIDATLAREVDGVAADTELKVDALEYTSAGKNDILTVFLNDEPFRVEKHSINIPSKEGI